MNFAYDQIQQFTGLQKEGKNDNDQNCKNCKSSCSNDVNKKVSVNKVRKSKVCNLAPIFAVAKM